jgi:hypothetical protein
MKKYLLSLIVSIVSLSAPMAMASGGHGSVTEFQHRLISFHLEESAKGFTSIGERLSYRIGEQPFLLVASIIFFLAIVHTFFAVPITRYAHKLQHDHDDWVREKFKEEGKEVCERDLVYFKATFFHFLGEVEAIFGIWVIALIFTIVGFYDLSTAEVYIQSVNFTEPVFVVVIMALASTRPILRFAEYLLSFFARWGKETPGAWWLTMMIVAPLLGSFITEPGAMTIAAMLLAKKFYKLKPSVMFSYATLGLLFVNISIGGVLTNFAAPPVLMIAKAWNVSSLDMLMLYGDKAVLGIVTSTLLYFIFFRKELKELALKSQEDLVVGEIDDDEPVPAWIVLTHLAFMAWTVYFSHTPALFVGGFLFFLAFQQATAYHQTKIYLRGPILVGFFLGSLVVHGGLQGWWLDPVISGLTEVPLFLGSVILTSFNDNAAITFLASQVSSLGPSLKYAVLAGAVSGGGLTVIANAPNPAGQALLGKFFGDGVAPGKLLMGALIPTVIASLYMMLMPNNEIKDHPRKSEAVSPDLLIDPHPEAVEPPHIHSSH